MAIRALYLPDRHQVRSATDEEVPLLAAYGWTLMDASWGGSASPAGVQYVQAVPMGTWTIPHTLGRIPAVQVYIAGTLVDADVSASTSQVVIVFASPAMGAAVLI